MILSHYKNNMASSATSKISILCMFIRVSDIIYVETQFNDSKLCNFISTWEMGKATIKLCKKFFFHKFNKNTQRKPWMKCFVHSLVSRHLTLDSKLCNFITLWELIKAPQNFVQGTFSIKSLKICHKNRGEFLVSSLLNLGKFGAIRPCLRLA